ncbi:MAG: imidazoleglycerol-phosphate dehydratase HisB [Armatimonadetes bacterium]|nr:imidazoleglycerol-phosphate dehydratase HisB [Armatimonadota bacterium]
MSKGARGVRYAEVERESGETNVSVVLDLDGGSRRDVSTGLGFFDHMLELLAFHGEFDLGVQALGDLHVDDHHCVEDVGIVLGKAIRQCLEQSDPIERYASLHSVMDESLVLVALDISGRGQLHYEVPFRRDQIGELATENVGEFFRALAQHAGITLHIRLITGSNDHHIAEAVFKGLV